MRILSRLTGLAVLATTFAMPLLAQEGTPSPADSTAGWVFRWLNFGIVAALIVYGFRKAAPYFQDRREDIADCIAEGVLAREAAEKRRREVEDKVKGLHQEIEQIRRDAQIATEAEAVRLRALAKEDAMKIEVAAQAEIAAAERAAKMELRSLATKLAVERAESLLRTELTPKAEAELFRGFVEELERCPN
jgi:F-type H+-transporting ATPase subunit b